MEFCGVIYVVCRKLREQARPNLGEIWRWKRKEFEKHRNIEHFFAVANSRIIVSGEVPKKKVGTESKRYQWKTGSSSPPIHENEVFRWLSRFEKEAIRAFWFPKCLAIAKKRLTFLLK